jgi:hypothetical protein
VAFGRKTDNTNTYIVNVGLKSNKQQNLILHKRFQKGWNIKKQLVKFAQNSLNAYKNDGKYKKNAPLYHEHNTLAKKYETRVKKLKKDLEKITGRSKEATVKRAEIRKELEYETNLFNEHEEKRVFHGNELNKLQAKYKLSEVDFHKYVKKMQHKYSKDIDSYSAQVLASNVWKGVKDVLYGDGKFVHIPKFSNFNTISGKSNDMGIMIREKSKTVKEFPKLSEEQKLKNKDKSKNGLRPKRQMVKVKKPAQLCMCWCGLEIPISVRKSDLYAQELLEKIKSKDIKVKYSIIVKEYVGSEETYSLQIVVNGDRPAKRRRDGSFRNPLKCDKNARVGLDLGTSTVAVSSKKKCMLKVLGRDIREIDRQIRLKQRHMDRCLRASNPNNYNEDGTCKKSTRKNRLVWIYSNEYKKLRNELASLRRKKSVYLKESHNILVKEILSLGGNVFIEKMNFKALAKRATFAEGEEKNSKGKFKRKKRFGKSIQNRAPGLFVLILERKLKELGFTLNYVDTYKFKASQYNHATNECVKYSLNARTKKVAGLRVQRDLYSAFLLENSKDTLDFSDKVLCDKNFDNFIINHNKEVNRLEKMKESGKKLPLSMGI